MSRQQLGSSTPAPPELNVDSRPAPGVFRDGRLFISSLPHSAQRQTSTLKAGGGGGMQRHHGDGRLFISNRYRSIWSKGWMKLLALALGASSGTTVAANRRTDGRRALSNATRMLLSNTTYGFLPSNTISGSALPKHDFRTLALERHLWSLGQDTIRTQLGHN